jgi:hypothetical protein
MKLPSLDPTKTLVSDGSTGYTAWVQRKQRYNQE